ncbi:uncharacterized protein LOC113217062, partial [Frankliniella occidentalis]|uniref:Regulatory protein zeste n=1 Tax=Frankliniella occidentalis TaxID=133901 RepID=A0A6J1THE2_FRAOC
MEDDKKKRAPNFLPSEKVILADLLKVYGSAIECKVSNAQTRKEKEAAWASLCEDFNLKSNFFYRDVSQLKYLWDNMKKAARKAVANDRKERNATGGGVPNPSTAPTHLDEAVVAVIGVSATGLESDVDGDVSNGLMMLAPDMQYEIIAAEAVADDVNVNIDADLSNQQQQQQVQQVPDNIANWHDFKAPMLFMPKPPALKVGGSPSTSSDQPSSSSQTSSCAGPSQKRSIAEETEYVKQMKRRRPKLEADKQHELVKARLELTSATKESLDESKKRQDELHLLQKNKVEMETNAQKEIFELE